jgi:hypothetical protein
MPLLKSEPQPVRESVITHSSTGVFAIQRGDWKLIAGQDPALYNLTEDAGETKNLAIQHPELATELTVLLKKLIDNGRSTPGPQQTNDVPVEVIKKKTDSKTEEPAA